MALRTGALVVPDRYNPWADLSLTEPPHFLTRYKLARLSKDRDLCQRVLATSNLEYVPIPDETTDYACGFHNAVKVSRTSVAVGEPFALSCRAAVALALWEEHVLQTRRARPSRQTRGATRALRQLLVPQRLWPPSGDTQPPCDRRGARLSRLRAR